MSRNVISDESTSWYEPNVDPIPTNLDIDLEEDALLRPTPKDSVISTRVSGPQKSLSDQSTSRPSPKSDKGKTKMPEYEDDQSESNESAHSLDSEYGGLDVPVMRTPGAQKALKTANKKLCCSSREKNLVSRFGYNDYMAYHYVLIQMKVATAQDPRWVEVMN